ncbi:MAG: hypothetical protein Q8S94_07740 [Pseudohongiella sp.]|nr:hypothetical protein [Pseudohongiella sp.]
MQNESILSESKLDEIARARQGFVLVMLVLSVCSLAIDLLFI